MPILRRSLKSLSGSVGIPGRVSLCLSALVLAFSTFLAAPVLAQTCPDLSRYYPDDQTNLVLLEAQLAGLMEECLASPEFFALYGAALLGNGKLNEALESLERALLLNPEHGAAQIDYAQALYLGGQLFPALEMNNRLLNRSDLPADLETMLQSQRVEWESQTQQKSFQADLLTGFDSNLNGAPDPTQITLTLAGDSVVLPLGSESQAISGPYLNFRLAGRYGKLTPQSQHNWLAETRGRISEDSESDLLQVDGRYAYLRSGRDSSLQLTGGISNLLFGGSPLYTAAEGGARYRRDITLRCDLHADLALQHQHYHGQAALNSLESKAGGGVGCVGGIGAVTRYLGLDLNLLNSAALKDSRPGGHRDGWQLRLDWQFNLPKGVLSSEINHTRLEDRTGYSNLLENGAERWLDRTYLYLQYRQPLAPDLALLINFYHQHQESNIELFESFDTTFEIGFSLDI